VETLLGLNAMMQLLKAVKIYERDVCRMFCDSQSSFEGDVLINFKVLINIAHDNINLCWIIDLNACIDHLAFKFVGQHI
jgi:hypothetical protein